VRGRASAVAATVIVAATFAAAPARAWELGFDGQVAGNIRTEINRVRTEHGLMPLRAARPLRTAAAQHVYEMAVLGYFNHTSPNRRSFGRRIALYYPPSGSRPWHVGENLLWWAAPISARTVVQFWLASPSHRAELLGPYFREVGVSAAHVAGASGVFAGRRVVLVDAAFGVRN